MGLGALWCGSSRSARPDGLGGSDHLQVELVGGPARFVERSAELESAAVFCLHPDVDCAAEADVPVSALDRAPGCAALSLLHTELLKGVVVVRGVPLHVDARAGFHGVRAHLEVVTDLRRGRHRTQCECRYTDCREDGRTRGTSVENTHRLSPPSDGLAASGWQPSYQLTDRNR